MVLNPGFEEYYPNFFESDREIGSFKIDTLPAKHWYDLNFGTPDYIHKSDVLSNYYDFKVLRHIYPELHATPIEGEASIAFVGLSLTGAVEQITGVLKSPLLSDSLYVVGFKIKLINISYICLNSIGILFSIQLPLDLGFGSYGLCDYEDICSLQIRASIEFDISSTCESDEWLEVNTIYKAKGDEKYLTLGYFYQENHDLLSVLKKFEISSSKNKRYIKRIRDKYINNPLFMTNSNYHTIEYPFSEFAYIMIDDVKVEPAW